MKLEHVDGNKKTGKILFEIGILIMVANLVGSYGIWQAILSQWKIINGGSLCVQAFIHSHGVYFVEYLNQESLYTFILSVLFSFLGNKVEVVPIINLIFQLLGILFFYFGAKKINNFWSSLVILFFGMISSLFYYPILLDDSMHGIWFLSGLIFLLGIYLLTGLSRTLVGHILLGILLGLYSYIDLSGWCLTIFFIIFSLFHVKGEEKKKVLHLVGFFMGWVNAFFVMFYLWNNFALTKENFVIWYYDKISFLCSVHKSSQYVALLGIMTVGLLFYVFLKVRNTESRVKIYENKNVVDANIESMNDSVSVQVTEGVCCLETSENTNTCDIKDNGSSVENEPIDKPVIKFIENPLPLPKKHVKKEMTYAFEPTKDLMHYDLNNYDVEDDYDLKEK